MGGNAEEICRLERLNMFIPVKGLCKKARIRESRAFLRSLVDQAVFSSFLEILLISAFNDALSPPGY
jgi:hypothetical protein